MLLQFAFILLAISLGSIVTICLGSMMD